MKALRLAMYPSEVLIGLVLLATLCVYAAPRLMGWAFRRMQPALQTLARKALSTPAGDWLKRRFPELFDDTHEDWEARVFLLVYSLLALVLMLLSCSVFVVIALAVLGRPEVQAFDTALAQNLRAHTSPGEVRFFSTITHLAGIPANYGLGLLVALALVTRREWALLQVWLVGQIGSGVLITYLKAVFGRPRPVLERPLAVESGLSFPSGHSVSSLVLYGLLSYIMVLTLPRIAARPLILLTLVMGVSIGMSRIVLGVHFFSDVLAGWSVGGAWLSLVLAGAEYRRRRALLKLGKSDLSVDNPPECT